MYDQNHIYYRLQFKLRSSLLIGNGLSKNTDNDVLLNAEGKPFIPGTTIAGMLRDMAGCDGDELFGTVLKGDRGNISSLYVYDACTELMPEQIRISKRDNVALDQYKTAIDGKKYDYEVIEPDIDFIGLIEINKNVPVQTKEKAEMLLGCLAAQGCCLGVKKTRGMGRMDVEIQKRSFNLGDPAEKERWLDFHPFCADSWKQAGAIKLLPKQTGRSSVYTLRISLRQKGGLSIRVYTTDLADVDYRTIRYSKDTDAVLVPGTSWAGAFRARVGEFVSEDTLTKLFGDVVDRKNGKRQKDTNEPDACRSLITFSETRLTGGSFKKINRNAIDRFSGKVKDTSLYGEETYYGGKGELVITLPGGDEYAQARQASGAAVADLHHGLLAVGGLTAVGRGLFEIEEGGLKLNEETVDISKPGWENDLLKKLGVEEAEDHD